MEELKHKRTPTHDDGLFDYRDKEILLNYVKQSKTSYVIPSCNDTAYETGAYISSKGESLIPGYDNLGKAMTLLKKNLFKKHLTQEIILTAKLLHRTSKDPIEKQQKKDPCKAN